MLDTGSSGIFIAGGPYKSSSAKKNELHYQPHLSKTAKETNETKVANYVSGSLHTKYYIDDVYIGNPHNGAIHIKDVKFGVAMDNSSLIEDFGFDAIVGMTAHNHMDPKIPTLMQTLKT